MKIQYSENCEKAGKLKAAKIENKNSKKIKN